MGNRRRESAISPISIKLFGEIREEAGHPQMQHKRKKCSEYKLCECKDPTYPCTFQCLAHCRYAINICWEGGKEGRRKSSPLSRKSMWELSDSVPWQITSVHSSPCPGSGRRMRHRKGDKGLKKLKAHPSVLTQSCLKDSPVTRWVTQFGFGTSKSFASITLLSPLPGMISPKVTTQISPLRTTLTSPLCTVDLQAPLLLPILFFLQG